MKNFKDNSENPEFKSAFIKGLVDGYIKRHEQRTVKIFEWQTTGYSFTGKYHVWLKWYNNPMGVEGLAQEEPTTEQTEEARAAFEDFLWYKRWYARVNGKEEGC